MGSCRLCLTYMGKFLQKGVSAIEKMIVSMEVKRRPTFDPRKNRNGSKSGWCKASGEGTFHDNTPPRPS